MVEIGFDKVVGHLFIDSMSLVTQEVPPRLAPSGEILRVWFVQITRNCYLRLSLKHFFKVVSLHQTGDCESRSTVKCAKIPFQSVAFRFWLDPISRSRCRMYVILYAGRHKVPPNITNGATYDLKKAYKPKRDLRYSHANKK